MNIFSDEAHRLLDEHVDEFFVSDDCQVVTHVGCKVIKLPRPSSPWGLRAVVLGHLEREHS